MLGFDFSGPQGMNVAMRKRAPRAPAGKTQNRFSIAHNLGRLSDELPRARIGRPEPVGTLLQLNTKHREKTTQGHERGRVEQHRISGVLNREHTTFCVQQQTEGGGPIRQQVRHRILGRVGPSPIRV